MKLEKNNRYFTISVYVLLCSLIVIVFASVCYHFNAILTVIGTVFGILKPIIYAAIMAFVFYPIERFISLRIFAFTERKKPHPILRKVLSLVLTYLIILALIVASFSVIFPQVGESYEILAAKAPDYLRTAQKWVDSQFSRLGVSVNVSGLVKAMLGDFSAFIGAIIPHISEFIGTFITEVKNIFLGLIISVYFLASRRRIIGIIKKISSAVIPPKAYQRLTGIGDIANRIFVEFIDGKLLNSLFIYCICFICMSILRLPYATLVSVIYSVTNLIPFVGPFIGAIPSAFIIFITSPIKALWFIIMITVIQQIDANFIEPKIVGNRTGLPVLYVVISVIAMGGLFGITGLFVCVPTFAVIYSLVREWAERRLAVKGLPTETAAYRHKEI